MTYWDRYEPRGRDLTPEEVSALLDAYDERDIGPRALTELLELLWRYSPD